MGKVKRGDPRIRPNCCRCIPEAWRAIATSFFAILNCCSSSLICSAVPRGRWVATHIMTIYEFSVCVPGTAGRGAWARQNGFNACCHGLQKQEKSKQVKSAQTLASRGENARSDSRWGIFKCCLMFLFSELPLLYLKFKSHTILPIEWRKIRVSFR